MLLWGAVGNGKSFMAGCIANALIDQGITVKMTNFATILNDMFDGRDKNAYVEALCRYELLIIDDLGVECGTEYAQENVFQIIDRRYRSKRPMVITTNLPISEMDSAINYDKKRIYDRILEVCTPICVDGENLRKLNQERMMKEMRELFGEGNRYGN